MVKVKVNEMEMGMEMGMEMEMEPMVMIGTYKKWMIFRLHVRIQSESHPPIIVMRIGNEE